MDLGLALTLCGLGAGFLIPAFILAGINVSRTRKCVVSTSAVVVDITVKNNGDDLTFNPVYEYEVDGVRFSNTGGYLSRRVPQRGSVIEIKYDPKNPKKSYIVGYDTKVYKILSIVFGIFGMIPILVCIGISISAWK